MRKAFFLLLAVTAVFFTQAATSPCATVAPGDSVLAPLPTLNAHLILLPVGRTGNTLSLFDLSRMSAKEFEAASGQKLRFFDRIGFWLGQRQLRRSMQADGTLKGFAVQRLGDKTAGDGKTGFHAGGFFLGLFFLYIGIVLAYLINDDKKKRRVKWAWIGAGIATVWFLLIIAAFGGFS